MRRQYQDRLPCQIMGKKDAETMEIVQLETVTKGLTEAMVGQFKEMFWEIQALKLRLKKLESEIYSGDSKTIAEGGKPDCCE